MMLAAQLCEGVVIAIGIGDLDREVTKDPEVEAGLRGAQPVLTCPLPSSECDDLVVVHDIS